MTIKLGMLRTKVENIWSVLYWETFFARCRSVVTAVLLGLFIRQLDVTYIICLDLPQPLVV